MSALKAMRALLKLKEIHGHYSKVQSVNAYAKKLGNSTTLTWDDAKFFEDSQITAIKQNLKSNDTAVKAAAAKEVVWPDSNSGRKYQSMMEAIKRHGAASDQAKRAIMDYYFCLTTYEKALKDMKSDADELLGVFMPARTHHGICKTYAGELKVYFETWAKMPTNSAQSAQCFVYSRDCHDIMVSAGKLADNLNKVNNKLRSLSQEIQRLITDNRQWIDHTKRLLDHQKSEAKASKSSKNSAKSSGKTSNDPLLVNLKKNQNACKPKRLAA